MSASKNDKPILLHGIYFKENLDPFIDESKVEWKTDDESGNRYHWYKDYNGMSHKVMDIGKDKRAVVQSINMRVMGTEDE